MRWVNLADRQPDTKTSLGNLHLRLSTTKQRFVFEQFTGGTVWGHEVERFHTEDWPPTSIEWLDETAPDLEQHQRSVQAVLDLMAKLYERWAVGRYKFDFSEKSFKIIIEAIKKVKI